jgi:hypothetical protein
MITADCGRSNGSRMRLWKIYFAELATGPGLTRPTAGGHEMVVETIARGDGRAV